MIIDDIKNYLSEDKKDEFIKIINEVYGMTEHLNSTYPGYKDWFFDKQVNGCYTPSRDIIFVKSETGELAGISCLKKDEEEKKIGLDITKMALKKLNVDESGLDEMDYKYLKAIIERYKGGPVGLNAVAASIGEEVLTLEDVCEPYLLQEGFIIRSNRGRCVTEKAYKHLGYK